MKIIGKAAEYGDEWICTVTTTELEKFLGLYYGKMPPIKLGDVIDLGRGHDYAAQIGSAMTKTREFVQANQAIVTAIMQGMSIEAVTAAAAQRSPENGAA